MKIEVSGYFRIYKSKEINIDDCEVEGMTKEELEQHLDDVVNEWVSKNMCELEADEYCDIGYEIQYIK